MQRNSKKETVDIKDKNGFIYRIVFDYNPHLGFTTAYHDDNIIGQCELAKIREPYSDDDREWEAYEERLGEWKDEIKSNLVPICVAHFSNPG